MDKFNPKAGSKISRNEAKKMVKAFKDKHADRLQAYYFGAEHYQQLLSVPGCAGIRIFNGLDDAGNQVMILTATDVNGDTITTDDPIEQGQPCPPFCAPEP